ncbi:CBS domain-containing protein [Aeromicrobium sp.]|uniref:CBS domain-containing protein n=1 Tax=Aeromicrobium sp. TaxID=1871063 RepID=UPI002FCB3BE8
MRARELAKKYPTVGVESDAWKAAQTMARDALPGLIVLAEDGSPYAVLPGSQVLRFVVPQYVQDDLALARVYNEEAAEELCRRLTGKTVHELLPSKNDQEELPVVDGDATAMEVAAVMARMHSPIVAVVEDGKLLGAITASKLLGFLMPDTGAAS